MRGRSVLPIATIALMVAVVVGCGAAGAGSQAAQSPPPAASPVAAAPSSLDSPEASASATPIPGCLPQCVPGSLIRPGALTPGEYTSKNFFGGQLVVTVPGVGWTSHEDSTGELKLQPGGDDHTLDFWLDIYPIVDGTFQPVKGYDGTARSLIDWVAANPNIRVLHRTQGTLGGLKADVIDFERGPRAKNIDPGCPSADWPCVGLFSFEQWDGTYSQGGPFKLRLFGADVTWGGEKHAVYAMITTYSPTLFTEFAPTATTIVEGARLPLGVGQ